MTVSFSSLQEFLDEIVYCTKKQTLQGIDDQVIRVCIEKKKVNPTTIDVTLTAGFTQLGELRQFICHCGEDYLPSRLEGSDVAECMMDEIKKCCELRRVEIRGGKYESE